MSRLTDIIPLDQRAGEILFGTIMTLSVLSTLQVTANQQVNTFNLFAAAIGSTLAWGFVDAVMYLVNTLIERTRTQKVLDDLHQAPNQETFKIILEKNSPAAVIERINAKSLRHMYTYMKTVPHIKRAGLKRKDYVAALAIWWLVVSAILPLSLPFLLIEDPHMAFRVTQVIAVLIMYGLGVALGKWTGSQPWKSGVAFAMIGIVMTVVCIALGG